MEVRGYAPYAFPLWRDETMKEGRDEGRNEGIKDGTNEGRRD